MNQGSQGLEALPCLWRHEAIRAGLRRVLLGCLEVARASTTKAHPASEDIHQARLALKRARAVLRLGDACGMKWTAPARRRLAVLACELAGVRNESVVVRTAQWLSTKLATRGKQAARLLASRRPVQKSSAFWVTWSRRLGEARRRFAGSAWPVLTGRELHRALARSARRLRKRERAATAGGGPVAHHEWRKAVIVLREQFNVLRCRLPRSLRNCAGQLHCLARKLGTARDLQLFIVVAQRSPLPAGRLSLVNGAARESRHALKHARRHWKKAWRVLRREFALA